MKQIIIIIISLLMLPSILAINECTGVTLYNDVPCLIFLPLNFTTSSCETINVTFYKDTIAIYNMSLSSYTTSLCNATFNLTTPGTYINVSLVG